MEQRFDAGSLRALNAVGTVSEWFGRDARAQTTRRDLCTRRPRPFLPRGGRRSMPALGLRCSCAGGCPRSTTHVGDAVAVRDRVVLWVLGCGAPGTLLAWRLLGPWPGMLLLIATLLVAALAYRIEPPR